MYTVARCDKSLPMLSLWVVVVCYLETSDRVYDDVGRSVVLFALFIKTRCISGNHVKSEDAASVIYIYWFMMTT